jgi:hypothetical protein
MAREVGHWIPPGIAMGAEENRGVLDKTMQGLVDPQAGRAQRARSRHGHGAAHGRAGRRRAGHRPLRNGAAPTTTFNRLMRKIVRVKGRGNVQVAFGQ